MIKSRIIGLMANFLAKMGHPIGPYDQMIGGGCWSSERSICAMMPIVRFATVMHDGKYQHMIRFHGVQHAVGKLVG